jgi:hypothetical protein
MFQQQWNNHGLRTEHHESPIQRFVGRSLENCNSQLTAMQDFFPARPSQQPGDAQEIFNEEWINDADQSFVVNVPGLTCPFDETSLATLQQTINPVDDTPDIGIDLYIRTLNFVEDHRS